MSNCIELWDSTVVFKAEDFDMEAWGRIEAEHASHERVHIPVDPMDTFCWFLKWNSKHLADGSLEIKFGQGASSHTWRDFRWIVREVSTFIREGRTVRHTFEVADELDDFKTHGPLGVKWQRNSATMGYEILSVPE